MTYKVIGIMSGSSLDGLDIVYANFNETGGKWNFELITGDCYPFDKNLKQQLLQATTLLAKDYLLLHSNFGEYIGKSILQFIQQNNLQHAVDFICSHGHTVFHIPKSKMTAQLGEGAAIAAITGLPVITDLRSLDVAFGGQGAPIVPVGEKYLFSEYPLLLNLGGISNLTFHSGDEFIAFDICPTNRVLNALAKQLGKEYDDRGQLASGGMLEEKLLHQLNTLEYYQQKYPKSLSNDFGDKVVLPAIQEYSISVQSKLRTYSDHIAFQVYQSCSAVLRDNCTESKECQMLVSGGGVFNTFLVNRIQQILNLLQVKLIVPAPDIVKYKEALIMAFIGVLRWREQNTTLASVTGATRDSSGGACWMGQQY
jgi:anhydro-N-acetylmuramic acid kinase